MKKRNTIVALIVLAVTAALYLSLFQVIDPRAIIFPRIVILVMGALAILLLVQGVLLQPASNLPVGDEPKAQFPWKPVLLVLNAILLYLAVMQNLGFYLATFLFFSGVILILARKTLSLPKGLKMVAWAFVFTAVMYLLFNVLLKVQLPRGIFL